MRTPGAVALRTSAIDSATTSSPSVFSRLMPISVSMPNWMSMITTHNCGLRLSNRIGLRLVSRSIRGQSHHIARIEIRQLQPIFRDIAGREKIVFAIFPLQRLEQILQGNGRLTLQLNGSFDGKFLRPFNNRGNNRATGQIASIEVIVPSAPEGD